jgi:hypothetical protein
MKSSESFRIPMLKGRCFEQDNQTIIDSPGWAWIEPHDMAENGRNAVLALISHHYNGEGELSKRTAIAKAKPETPSWRGMKWFSWSKSF